MYNNDEKIQITAEGLKELKDEFDQLVGEKRPVLVERLSSSRQAGDLGENSEYLQAKEELSFIDGRISELEEVINKAVVVGSRKNCNCVSLGCRVVVRTNSKMEQIFSLVGEWEANPATKKISHTSPLGKSLLGKKVGEEIKVEAPAGTITYTILKIS